MRSEFPHRGITIHKLPVGGNVPGIVFAVGSIVILLLAIPALWFVTVAAIAAGFAAVGILRMVNFEPEEPPSILSANNSRSFRKQSRAHIHLKRFDW